MNKYYVWNEGKAVLITADSVGHATIGDSYGTLQFIKGGQIVAEVDAYDGWALDGCVVERVRN